MNSVEIQKGLLEQGSQNSFADIPRQGSSAKLSSRSPPSYVWSHFALLSGNATWILNCMSVSTSTFHEPNIS